ncbi:MAG: phenylalanine--tRNA ligase subunit beta, partial [bacterium]|nr:phenylalanine--tRNA ligase subunit beta [bacterium]
SARELGLEEEHFEDGIMILDGAVKIGENAVEALGLGDGVLDLDVTPNRPDCLCVLGLAREYAAAMGRPLRLPQLLSGPYSSDPGVRVEIETAGCRRYVAQRFDGVRTGAAPAWMRVRLSQAGQRPISNLVDISNYVMLEVGQPLHFFDWKSVAGGHIIVRDGGEGERMTTLDGVERTLDPSMMVVADEAGPSTLAGIRGSARSEVTDETTQLLLEAANFEGKRTRRTSLALGLRTDASLRNEKALPLAFTDLGAARAAQLLADEGAAVHAPIAAGQELPPPKRIAFAVSEVPRILGIAIDDERVAANLRALGFGVVAQAPGTLSVEVPPWRGDIAEGVDLVEEVARIEGYDAIPSELPPIAQHGIESDEWHLENNVARALAQMGYNEIISLPLQSGAFLEKYQSSGVALPAEPIEIVNPLSEEQRYLRFAIMPGMLHWLSRNKQELPRRVFEIGHAFRGNESPLTEGTVTGVLYAVEGHPEPDWRDGALLEFRGEMEALLRNLTGVWPDVAQDTFHGLHPGKTASLLLAGENIAQIGRVDPRLCAAFEVPQTTYYCFVRMECMPPRRVAAYQPVPRLPGTSRDLALVIDENVAAEAIVNALLRAGIPQIERVLPFDEYRGPQVPAGRKSVAVRIWLREPNQTITDAIADETMSRVVEMLRESLGAEPRT